MHTSYRDAVPALVTPSNRWDPGMHLTRVCVPGRCDHRSGMNPDDAHPLSVSDDDVEAFAAAFTAGLDGLDEDASESLVVAADRANGSLDAAVLEGDGVDAVAVIDQVTSSRRRILGMASRVAWARRRHETRSPAWLLVVVAVGQPVLDAVRRDGEAGWWRLTQQLPWFALSTAEALRGAVERGEPLRLKVCSDPEILQRPDEGEPPVDDQGHLQGAAAASSVLGSAYCSARRRSVIRVGGCSCEPSAEPSFASRSCW